MLFTPDEIQSRLRVQPFQPVRFVTSSGQQYDVYHPDQVMVYVSFVTIGIKTGKNPDFPDREARLALAHITDMIDLDAPVPTAGVAADAE